MRQLYFDLDGTIIDSSEGIFASVRYALNKMNKPEPTLEILRTFIGPPLVDSFKPIGFSDLEAACASALFLENSRISGIRQVSVYDGVATALEQLSKKYTLNIATSKLEIFAKEILLNVGLANYFAGIYGADSSKNRVTKTDVLHYALETSKNQQPASSFMIGDRKHDIQGAQAHGMPAIGVLWGFGDREELVAAEADAILRTPAELATFLKA